ncbi:MAG: aromatic acid exporter family protein [Candidatus Limiplasma sp.]|nr:aromatic acid exporter family protein [Candidatus Limiplasma sp.]
MHLGQFIQKPTFGMRNIKTALTAAFCAMVYSFLGRSPAFACIGVVFALGSDMGEAYRNGGNRLYGTLIGGLLGIVLFRIYLIFVPDGHHTPLLALFTFLGTILLIGLCQAFWVGGVQPGGVVLCILLFNTPVDSYVSYALNRIFDTAVGVVLGLAVCWVFPRDWRLIWRERLARLKAGKANTAE